MFPKIVSCSTLRIGPYLFHIEKFITQFKTTKNDDLPLRWQTPAVKKEPPFSHACRLIMCEIMRSGDVRRLIMCEIIRSTILGNDLKHT